MNPQSARALRIALACALLCGIGAAIWQGWIAHADYGGNWTAFYRTGAKVPLPPLSRSENLYLLQGAGGGGYDGQYYRLIAQDPWLLRGTERFIDAPRLRYRRILIPALAWAAALGQPRAITYSYIAVVDLLVAIGVYWLSRWASVGGLSPWWGLAWLCVPGTMISIDRLVVDVGIASFTVGFALYWRQGQFAKLWTVMALAGLAKEMAVPLAAAYCLHAAFRREWRRAALMLTAGVPAALWYAYVQIRTPDYPADWFQLPFSAALKAMLHPELYPDRKWFIAPFEYLAWFGLIFAIGLAIARWSKESPLSMAACLFAALAATASFPVWIEAEGFGRVFTPLLILLPLARPDWWSVAPIIMIAPRALALPLAETLSAISK